MASVQRYDTTSSSLTTTTQVEPGRAYFVQVATASTWTPSLPKDPTTRFVYDGDGGRVKQTTAAGTTRYLGEVYEIGPTTSTKYVFAGSQRIAAKDSSGTLRFYHGDHLGSSNVVTDGTGALVELNEHTPYGALSRHEGTADVRHKFTGQHQDASTGLILFPARAYDPQLGRFLQPDPFVQNPTDPQTLNRYSYVRNNPANLVDPSGYSFWSKFFGIIIGVAVAVATGNIYLGYETFKAVDREIAASSGTGEAIVRTYAVVVVMLAASGPQDEGLDPTGRTNKEEAADARRAGDLTHEALDAAYGTHAQELEEAKASLQEFGLSPQAAESFLRTTPKVVAPALGAIYNSLNAAKWQDLWANARFHRFGPPVRGVWSGVQGVSLLFGGLRLVEPYARVGSSLTVDQAQAISAIRGIRWTAVTYAAGKGAALGFAVGGGPAGVPLSLVTASAGAALLGGATDYFAGRAEEWILDWAGYSNQ